MSIGRTSLEKNKNGVPAPESEYYGRDIGQENCQNQDQLIIIYIFLYFFY
jgi:hypothetical protein